jgi:hypothetical protein
MTRIAALVQHGRRAMGAGSGLISRIEGVQDGDDD